MISNPNLYFIVIFIVIVIVIIIVVIIIYFILFCSGELLKTSYLCKSEMCMVTLARPEMPKVYRQWQDEYKTNPMAI